MNPSERCFELLKAGDFEALRSFLDQTPGAAETRDSTGVSLLMHLVYRGQRDLAAAIAARRQSLDIFEAAALGREDRLQPHLADAGTVNSYSADGFTALHFASYFGQAAIAHILLEKGAKPDAVANNPTRVMPLHSAASARNLEAARLLLDHGALVNARQQAGWVPIHAAAQNGDRAMVDLLLQRGADPGLTNDDGKTAAMVAADKGHPEIAALLTKQKTGS